MTCIALSDVKWRVAGRPTLKCWPTILELLQTRVSKYLIHLGRVNVAENMTNAFSLTVFTATFFDNFCVGKLEAFVNSSGRLGRGRERCLLSLLFPPFFRSLLILFASFPYSSLTPPPSFFLPFSLTVPQFSRLSLLSERLELG